MRVLLDNNDKSQYLLSMKFNAQSELVEAEIAMNLVGIKEYENRKPFDDE